MGNSSTDLIFVADVAGHRRRFDTKSGFDAVGEIGAGGLLACAKNQVGPPIGKTRRNRAGRHGKISAG